MNTIDINIKDIDGQDIFLEIPFCSPEDQESSILDSLSKLGRNVDLIGVIEDNGSYEIVESIVSKCCNAFELSPQKLNETKNELFYFESEESKIKLLVGYGIDINFIPKYKNKNALEYAVENLSMTKIEFLMNKGLEGSFGYNRNILHLACKFGRLDLVQFLDNGCEIMPYLRKLTFHDETPIHYAAYSGNVDIIKILFDHGADHSKCVSGETPLHKATHQEKYDAAVNFNLYYLHFLLYLNRSIFI